MRRFDATEKEVHDTMANHLKNAQKRIDRKQKRKDWGNWTIFLNTAFIDLYHFEIFWLVSSIEMHKI